MGQKVAVDHLRHLSDEVMQELLYVDLLCQVAESLTPQTTSPYFQATPHLKKALKLLTLKKSVRLNPKSTDELVLLLDKLQHKAREVVSSDQSETTRSLPRSLPKSSPASSPESFPGSFPRPLLTLAKKLSEVDEKNFVQTAIQFGKLYYASFLDRFR